MSSTATTRTSAKTNTGMTATNSPTPADRATARRSRRAKKDLADRRRRAERLMDLKLEFIDHDDFHQPDAEAVLMSPFPEAEPAKRKSRGKVGRQKWDGSSVMLTELCRTPLLTRQQELHLFRRFNYARFRACTARGQLNPVQPRRALLDEIERFLDDAEQSRNHIVRANLRLVVSISKTYSNTGIPFDDLLSEGNVSLIRAAEKFNCGTGYRFSTYATRAIRNNTNHFVNKRYRIRQRFLHSEDGTLSSASDFRLESLGAEAEFNRIRGVVRDVLKKLDAEKREIIMDRFGMNADQRPRSLKRIGEERGVSRERVRQIQAKALRELQAIVEQEKVEPPRELELV